MALAFKLEDVVNRRPISADSVLVGLNPEEQQIAGDWISRLRAVEGQNVTGSLATVLSMQEFGNSVHPDHKVGFAMVAAGSSLHAPEYGDIDMFMIPETFEHGRFMQSITLLSWMGRLLQGLPTNLQKVLPDTNQGFNCIFCFENYEPGKRLGKDEAVHGKQIQMYLLLDKFDFEFPRQGRQGDIIYRPGLNAEQLIQLNRRNRTHMIPLARSYVLGDDYSKSAAGNLEVTSSETVEIYANAFRHLSDAKEYIRALESGINRTFDAYFQSDDFVLPPSPLELRKQLQRRVMEAFSERSTEKLYMNYADALINREVKEQFRIT